MVQVDLTDLSDAERLWLMNLMQKSEKATSIAFGVTTQGQSHLIQIMLMSTEQETVAEIQ